MSASKLKRRGRGTPAAVAFRPVAKPEPTGDDAAFATPKTKPFTFPPHLNVKPAQSKTIKTAPTSSSLDVFISKLNNTFIYTEDDFHHDMSFIKNEDLYITHKHEYEYKYKHEYKHEYIPKPIR